MRQLVLVYFPVFIVLAYAPVILLTFRRMGMAWGRIFILILWLFGMTEVIWVITYKLLLK